MKHVVRSARQTLVKLRKTSAVYGVKAPPPHTNNRAEMLAIIEAIETSPLMVDMIIHSDSEYVLKPMMDGRYGRNTTTLILNS